MMEQYRRIKREHQGEVLFFRLGDFYEMFFEDALEVSALLNLTLTSRAGQPMCGIPYHASRSYIARLLRLGKKIAVCEQIGEAGKGLIERQVMEIITPGTTIEEDFLDKGSSNYLACIAAAQRDFSFAYIDLSAGDFHATSFPRKGAAEKLKQELERIQAKEIVVQESLLNEYPALASALEERGSLVVNRWADWLFDLSRSRERLEKQFGPEMLAGFGLGVASPEIISSGALLDYLDDTARSLIPHVRLLKVYGDSDFVGIDESTQRNLELLKNLSDGESRFSLFEVMDETRTAMGRRLLKTRMLHPLRSEELINRRLDMVESLYHSQEKLAKFRELLAKTPDLERLCSRLAMDKAHGKDMVAVKNALISFSGLKEETPDLNREFSFESQEALSLSADGLDRIKKLIELLERGIAEDPSILLSEGNLIRDSYNAELDKLREFRDSGRKLLEEYLEEERETTGIPGLKIKYNRLIGYFFEVSNVNLSKVPKRFIRRQGIAGGERFTTDRLAELESEINGASERVIELEKKLFLDIRDEAKKLLPEMDAAAKRIAELDAAQSLARTATVHNWSRPLVDSNNRIVISEGRHPVVEAHLPKGEFIPNDIALDAEGVTFALITGPNMAGKSTYLRQAALITLMAQSGSFVPASEARIGMVDRIYCRVGASDNLARGESTFLVEMNETAYILNTATDKSLVIMDEVGRGTGTKDGLSIAWAVCEELLNNTKCRTLFATHYHELSGIVHSRLVNRSMDIVERNGKIVFLRKLREGPAAESYGLHVAALAGLPAGVLSRAGEIMGSLSELKTPPPDFPAATGKEKPDRTEPKIIETLLELETNDLTPLEALNLIHRWKKLVQSEGQDYTRKTSVIPVKAKNPSIQDEPSLFDN
jgi:DNA mismatch repair protein MutS